MCCGKFKNQGGSPRLAFGEAGQALLIVVLVMVVALTVGLSLISRSVTNLRTATEEENSQRAFSAAEAGVEQAIKTGFGLDTAKPFDNNSSISQVTVSPVSGSQFPLYGGNTILQDDTVTLWLSDYSTDATKIYQNPWSGNLTVYFGSTDQTTCDPVSNSEPALEIVLISGTKAAPKSTHYAVDPCAARRGVNNFSDKTGGSATIGGKNYLYQYTISNIVSGLIVRITPLYAKTQVGVQGSSSLPTQGNTISSTGVAGNTSRKITFFQGFPEIPSEFSPNILFSPKP